MESKKVTGTQLDDIIHGEPAPWRVGSTTDVDRRSQEYLRNYPRETKGSTMYYAPTKNMKTQETRDLQNCKQEGGCAKNVHEKSNAPAVDGNRYAIVKDKGK